MDVQFSVYIVTNQANTVLYTGITNNLRRRMFEHREKLTPGFTQQYNVTKLVYFELYNRPKEAIAREKQIKAGSRRKKIQLIESMNQDWRDLYPEII